MNVNVDIELSRDQREAVDGIVSWAKKGGELLTFGGVAGSGKSFIISCLSKILREETSVSRIAFCSFTGRATQILRNKLSRFSRKYIYHKDNISTIHSLIYRPLTNELINKRTFEVFPDDIKAALEIIEAKKLWEYVKEYISKENEEDLRADLSNFSELLAKSSDCTNNVEDLDLIKKHIGYIEDWGLRDCKKELGELLGWSRVSKLDYDLIVIDEASMVSEDIFRDLASYGIPILAVGDHAQLPPVVSKFNLMESPKIKLEKIHRQAEGSPIIEMSRTIREGCRLEFKNYGENVAYVSCSDKRSSQIINNFFYAYGDDSIVICGTNNDRIKYNKIIRECLGFNDKDVLPGEKVICLKNNNDARNIPIYNGMIGRVVECKSISNDWYNMKIIMDCGDGVYIGNVSRHFFDNAKKEKPEEIPWALLGDIFDRGYAITCHKAQGGQWNKVLLFDRKIWEHSGETEENYRRWLYTGITRAVQELYVIR